ncbi:hypothetical protein KPH14_007316 [Odynerus spinipes]|uniref:Transmembrane protein 151B n=1 Tax=Odynerus spinipes TaxID=1348599 RepID=A0AAD9RA83_9HYME|nr:hypothetical protein KPH14_007316 [Odynerus spinipes]
MIEEIQQPVSQTFCGALQKEPNCKCLVLSVLIYGCLAAVTWCRCANVTKVVINFSKYPIKSTKHVSPCDDGYIYIPVAFMGMLYLVYLVECYHSPIRIDLSHAESQDCVLSKLNQLRLAQPTIWWKAVSYHYVRRKRQITRYRNGDNYTTTQVYYERVNTHAATSFYYYDYCGVKDISKELIPDPKAPITKIALSKGFAFSNMRSATEFEEARSRFFAEQELRDDYMEMREGLDLGCNLNPTTLVAVLGKPWFTNRYVYWCLSALLLSWPLRVIIEYNTQYADYQVTKLFGVNYDTPIGAEPIRTSTSQLSQPGSYMLAPSYSEALLMEPAVRPCTENRQVEPEPGTESEIDMGIVPSYSEALLYERAEVGSNLAGTSALTQQERKDLTVEIESTCQCPCHKVSEESDIVQEQGPSTQLDNREFSCVTLEPTSTTGSSRNDTPSELELGPCSCGQQSPYVCPPSVSDKNNTDEQSIDSGSGVGDRNDKVIRPCFSRRVKRDISEPNLRSRSEIGYEGGCSSKTNGRSLENILEEETMGSRSNVSRVRSNDVPEDALRAVIDDEDSSDTLPHESMEDNATRDSNVAQSKGAIPKRTTTEQSTSRCRVTVNPRSDEVRRKIPVSRTYFCLKSILKQNKRRYTLMTTAQELEHIGDWESARTDRSFEEPRYGSLHLECERKNEIAEIGETHEEKIRAFSWRESLNDTPSFKGKEKGLVESFSFGREKSSPTDQRHDGARTLIFASPIQEVCPDDPFGGKNVVPTRNQSYQEETSNVPMLVKLRRSFTEREGIHRRHRDIRKIHRRRTFAVDADYSFPLVEPENYETTNGASGIYVPGYRNGVSFPPYDGFTRDGRTTSTEQPPVVLRNDARSSPEGSLIVEEHFPGEDGQESEACGWSFDSNVSSTLTRSLTERRANPKERRTCDLRRSFTGRVDSTNHGRSMNGAGKRTNLNMETSL